jgi:ribokinase
MKVTVIGSAYTEMIFDSPVIPATGQTVFGDTFHLSPGGRGVNQAIAARRAGGETVFIGRIGHDLFGSLVSENLAREKIAINHLVTDREVATGTASVVTDIHGDSAVVVFPGANSRLSNGDLMEAKFAISECDVLLLQLDVPLETIRYAAGLARSSGVRVILNPSPALPISDDLLKSVSVLTPDASEAEVLTGITITDDRSAELAGRILLERGLDRVIITLRTKGAMVIDNGGAEHVPGFKITVTDPTGVNDVFNGALAVGLAEGKNFYEAVLFANAAAALSSTRKGIQASIPLREEILLFM